VLRPAPPDPTSEAGGSVALLAAEFDYVVGVDTHLHEHVVAVVAAPAGAVLARQAVQANAGGYAAALRFAHVAAGGARVWAIAGTGSYGAGLARYLVGGGEPLLEVSRTARSERRVHGTDDSLDAARRARAARASETLALPRTGQRREALRLLVLARRSAVDVRREALVQLRSGIVTAPDQLRDLRGVPVRRLSVRCSRLRRARSAAPAELGTGHVLRSLARRIEAATCEAGELEAEILAHVRALVPRLLDEPGGGPIVAAQVIVACSQQAASAPKPPSPASPASHRSPPRAARQRGTDSAAAATGN